MLINAKKNVPEEHWNRTKKPKIKTDLRGEWINALENHTEFCKFFSLPDASGLSGMRKYGAERQYTLTLKSRLQNAYVAHTNTWITPSITMSIRKRHDYYSIYAQGGDKGSTSFSVPEDQILTGMVYAINSLLHRYEAEMSRLSDILAGPTNNPGHAENAEIALRNMWAMRLGLPG